MSYDEPKRIIMRQDYGLESDYCAPAPTVAATPSSARRRRGS